MRVGRVVVMAALAAGACGDDGGGGPVAKFAVPSSGAIGWGVAPFPSDLFLGESGTVELASLPSGNPTWEAVREDLQKRRGFCGSCPVHFPIDGDIDPATLAGGVVMIDPAGAKVPIDVQWAAEEHVIAVRPKRGTATTPGAHYIVAVTKDVHAVGGASLRADSGFTSARARIVTSPRSRHSPTRASRASRWSHWPPTPSRIPRCSRRISPRV